MDGIEVKDVKDVPGLIAILQKKVAESADPAQIKTIIGDVLTASQIEFRKSEVARGEEEPMTKPGAILLMKSADPKVIEFQKRSDDLYILSTILKSGIPGFDPRTLKTYKEMGSFIQKSELGKAMGTDQAGYGAEWVPTGFSAQLIDMVDVELMVAKLHVRINMPTDPYKVPGKKSHSTAYIKVESTAPDAGKKSKVGTRQLTLSATTLITWVDVSYELDEDSIVPVLPLIKADIVEALASAQENAAINGDNSTTHQDADITDAVDQAKAWKGYRKLALSGAKVDVGTYTAENVLSVRTKMGKYGTNPALLAWITSGAGLYKTMLLKDANNNLIFLGRDKYGEDSVVVKGELGKLFGSPLLVSAFVREDLNASGVYDGTTKTKTEILCVRKDGFLFGDRRNVTVETDKDIKAQTTDLVATQRLDFQPRYDASTEKIVGVGYNITSA